MKSILPFILFVILFGCTDSTSETAYAITDTTAAVVEDTPSSSTIQVRHKYSYVKQNEDGSMVAGLLELYGTNNFTQAVTINGFTQSGRGTFVVNGDKLILNKISGIAISGEMNIIISTDNKIWLTMSNGGTYVEDENSTYIKSMQVTPHFQNTDNADTESKKTSIEPINTDLVYEGTATDNQTGISQDYTLFIKSDFSSASIGGGPYNRIEDQGNGIYMWLDGSIIGMSLRPMRDKCIIYGADGNYFCTLYKR